MLKCIVSDIDGTLLHGTQLELEPEVLVQIARLRKAGVVFCPASGRQYHSLRRIFATIADEICYICENGSIVYGAGAEDTAQVLYKAVLPQEQTQQLCADIMALPRVEIVISGANTCYVCPKEQDLSNRLRTYLGNNTEIVSTTADVPEDIIKVTIFSHDGITPAVEAMRQKWSNVFHAVVSGRQWVDFSLSSKAVGVRVLCEKLGIDPSEVLAVGDNYNDVEMLQLVGQGYIMENAAEPLKAQFPNHCSNVAELLKSVQN